TEAVAHPLPAYAGLLLLDELEHLGRLLGDVEQPFVIVSGGAKVEDKLDFLVELPVDVVGAAAFEADAETCVCGFDELPDGWLGLDIGPETRARFAEALAEARTIFWNGPMGV